MGSQKDEIKLEEVHRLLEYACRNTYKARDSDTRAEGILNRCIKLFGKDYKYTVVNNSNGELCSHYPTRIVVLEYMLSEKDRNNDSVQSLYDVDHLKELFNKARFARCRARFAVPVILYEGKHICRSSTISGGAEIYGRSGFDLFFTGGESIPGGQSHHEAAAATGSSEWQLFNRIRGQDIKLLKTFSVTCICDLMVEKKKVKFGMNVTSSEKVDKENRYSDFCIWSLPYPGCEFFKDWRDNGYAAEGMKFDWNQTYVDAKLDLTGNFTPPEEVDWTKYRGWDLVRLTQNYLKLLLKYLREGDSGILVHCISGWDRTPLFMSLLRMTLWADGLVHQSLTSLELLYLTIAYDWFLFGHNFPDRLGKGEEIFFFCFNFLKYITGDEFSMRKNRRHGSRTTSGTDSECNIEGGVLLDPELQRASYRGSNTSISSVGSANSNKSSVDNAPIYFTAGSIDEDTFIPNSNPTTTPYHSSNPQRLSPVMRGNASHDNPPWRGHSNGSTSHSSSAAAAPSSSCQPSMTSPVAVPTHMRRVAVECRPNSPGFGSWQIISGSGSLRGSMSSYESPRSSASDHSSALGNGHTEAPEPHDPDDTSRHQRLDTLRQVFFSLYASIADINTGADAMTAGSGLSSLLGNFAEKVGIRNSNSVV